MFFLSCVCFAFVRLFICALWSPAGKGLTSWLSFVVSIFEFVTFPLVSWVSPFPAGDDKAQISSAQRHNKHKTDKT